MKKNEIKIGYEVGSGKQVDIPLSHLVVTGITQESGKTTTLQALIKRSGLRAIIFKTKIGERGINEGTIIPPYYKEIFDWEYASELLEASRKEKLKFERSWIIKYSKGADSMVDFQNNIQDALSNEKLRSLDSSVLTTLNAYLDKILPELAMARFSDKLDLVEGINIVDLERFTDETQGIIIRSILIEVLKKKKKVIVVIPEAWKHLPEKIGSPVKRPAEAFIRQGATNDNYLWLDSQDITGVSKTILKQVSTWTLGFQSEINEIKRTLDQIPLPKGMKPKPSDIASLKVGEFYVATPRFTKLVYVQPTWVDDSTAVKVAKGKLDVNDVSNPEIMKIKQSLGQSDYSENLGDSGGKSVGLGNSIESESVNANLKKLRLDLIEARNDFFDQIQALTSAQQEINQRVYSLMKKVGEIDQKPIPQVPEINEEDIISRVLLKVGSGSNSFVDKDEIVREVLSRVPSSGGAVYTIPPLEKIKKDFLKEIRAKILSDVETLNDDEKKIFKYIESKEGEVTPSELITKCMLKKQCGSSSTKMSTLLKSLVNIEVTVKTPGNRYKKGLMNHINSLMGTHNASEEEKEGLYNHILYEVIS
jgi:hypothetical protein